MNTSVFIKVLNYFTVKAETVFGVFIVSILGFLLIKKAEFALTKAFSKSKMDPTLNSFLKNMISIVLKMVLLLTILSMSGVKIASLLAILGAASLALGLSLQSSLANIAGGVILLILRPFRVGDTIEAGPSIGRVHAIQIFHTILKTQENKTIFLPNSKLTNDAIINHSMESKFRIDISLPIHPKSKVKTVKALVQEVLNLNEDILKDPEPVVFIGEWTPNALPVVIRAWAKTPDVQHIKQELIESIKEAFDEQGIDFPALG